MALSTPATSRRAEAGMKAAKAGAGAGQTSEQVAGDYDVPRANEKAKLACCKVDERAEARRATARDFNAHMHEYALGRYSQGIRSQGPGARLGAR